MGGGSKKAQNTPIRNIKMAPNTPNVHIFAKLSFIIHGRLASNLIYAHMLHKKELQ